MRLSAIYLLLMILLSGLFIQGCAKPGLKIQGVQATVADGLIYDLENKRMIDEAGLIERLSGKRLIFIGEYHQHDELHRRQLKIISGLFERNKKLAIGLEVFDRSRQTLLDDWTAGKLTEEEFHKMVLGEILNFATFSVYYPILDWARKNKVTLIALNAPRSVTGKIAKSGMGGLTDDDKKWIASDVVVGPEEYKNRVIGVFKGHGMHGGSFNLDNFFTAQVVWDETMAETLVEFFWSNPSADLTVVSIMGNEHVFRGHGVPSRVARRQAVPTATIIMPYIEEDEVYTSREADFIWTAKPEKKSARLSLGVNLDVLDNKVIIKSVAAGSEAERIGLNEGDRLVRINGKRIRSAFQLHRAAMDAGPLKEQVLQVDRNGFLYNFKFHFRETR